MFTVRVDFETCRYEPEVPEGVWGAVAGGSMPPVAAVRLAVQSPSVPRGLGYANVLKFVDSRNVFQIIFLPQLPTGDFSVVYLLGGKHSKRQMRTSGMI